MSRIRAKDTKAELVLRKLMWHRNIRFRVHSQTIFGRPDIYIQIYRLAIFVDGAFWHGYNWKEAKNNIKTNREFWLAKIERNMGRDIEVNNHLRAAGYTVMRFWDHEIFSNPLGCLNQIELYIESCKSGMIPEKE